MKQKILVLLFSLALCFSITPTSVHAQNPDVLKINGIDLSQDENNTATFGTGTATYDKVNKKLTLENVTISGNGTIDTGIYLPYGDVTIELIGTNSISNFDEAIGQEYDNNGAAEGSFTITGNGSLEIVNCDYITNGSSKNLTIDGITLNSANKDGILVANNITINNAEINISVTGKYASPLYSMGAIYIENSDVTASQNGNSTSYGPIMVMPDSGEGSVSINNSNVTLKGSGWGIISDNWNGDKGTIKIKDSTIIDQTVRGMYARESVELKDAVKIVTTENKRLIYAINGKITNNLNSDANLMGYVCEGTKTWLYLTDYTLKNNFNISTSGAVLTIPSWVTLTIDEKVTVTKGTNVKIINNGIIQTPCTNKAPIVIDEGNELSLQHDWNENWTWSSDGKTAGVKLICEKDATHIAEPKVTMSQETIKASTYTSEGKMKYIASTTFDGKEYSSENTLSIPMLPSIIEGANSEWTSGDLTFKLNDQLDDQAIDAKNYILKEGIEITLKQDYLSTLSQGNHTLSIVSKNGTATTTFEVKPALITNTGDSPLIMYHALLAVGSLVAILMLQSKRKSIEIK